MVGALGTGVGSVNVKPQHVAVLKEIVITNLNWLVGLSAAVNLGDASHLVFVHGEAMSEHNLAEDLGGDLEVLVVVVILEEALGIESVAAHNFLETANNVIDASLLVVAGIFAPVKGRGNGVTEHDVNVLLEALLGEDAVDSVDKFAPAHVVASLLITSGESGSEELELGVRDGQLGHGKTNSELSIGDETSAELVEITEEFANTNAVLSAHLSETGHNILNILRGVANNLGLGNARSGLGEVVV